MTKNSNKQLGKDYFISFKKSIPFSRYIKSGLLPLFLLGGFPHVTAAPVSKPVPDVLRTLTVTGVVKDTNNQPVIGASIVESGTTHGTITNVNGEYTLKVSSHSSLRISSIGYETKTIKVGDNNKVNVILSDSHQNLSELVVVGYGVQKKSDLTGAVASIKAEDFNKGVSSSVDQLLQGTTPGLNVQQASSEPGGGVNVRIRGNSSINAGSSPLYVIDGLPIDNSATLSASEGTAGLANIQTAKNPLNSLNPADIESVEVLKDASATAIYGSRAANGVILIQTKKGKAGKVKVDYSFEAGWQKASKKIDVLSTADYIKTINALAVERGQQKVFNEEDIQRIGKGTDWQDEILQTAFVQNHNISFSGGKENLTYFLSANYLNQDGIVKNTGTKRFGVRLNVVSNFAKYGKVGANMMFNRTNDKNYTDGNGLNEQGGPINSALLYDPTEPVHNSDGSLSQSSNLTINNPIGLIEGISNKSISTRILSNIFVEYSPISDLKLKLNVGTDLQNVRRDIYNSPLTIRGYAANGIADVATLERSDYLGELTANYHKLLYKLSLDALGGITYQTFNTRTFSGSVKGFPSDDIKTNNLGLGTMTTASLNSNRASNSLLSFLGRVHLSWDSKYLLTASFRADGSSRFGENNRFGYFPSFAAGWNLSNESFIPEFFRTLKLRASYGLTGNQDIGNYQSLNTYGIGGTFVSKDSYVLGISPSRIANPDLKWETTAQFDAGLDVSVFNGRFSFSFDYFIKNTTNMLIAQPLPRGTGYVSILKNLGSLRNQGIELFLDGLIIDTRPFQWDASLNLSTVRNKVTDLGNVDYILTGSIANGGNTSIIIKGKPAFSYYGYNVTGIFKNEEQVKTSAQPMSKPGYPIFEDINGDKRIDAKDQKIIGSPYPDFMFGLHNSLTWNRWNLSFLFQGQVGGKILNGNIIESLYPSNYRRNMLSTTIQNRWTSTKSEGKWPSGLEPTSHGGGKINSLALESASYVRLKFVQLSYSIPLLHKWFINTAEIYINAQNLFTISDYMGYNPEANTFGSSSAKVDLNSYPLARTWSIGIRLSF